MKCHNHKGETVLQLRSINVVIQKTRYWEWTQADAAAFHEYFKIRMKSNAPLKCVLTYRKRLYYYRGTKTYPLLQVSFKTEDGLRHIQNICKFPIEIAGLPRIQFTPREF